VLQEGQKRRFVFGCHLADKSFDIGEGPG